MGIDEASKGIGTGIGIAAMGIGLGIAFDSIRSINTKRPRKYKSWSKLPDLQEKNYCFKHFKFRW